MIRDYAAQDGGMVVNDFHVGIQGGESLPCLTDGFRMDFSPDQYSAWSLLPRPRGFNRLSLLMG